MSGNAFLEPLNWQIYPDDGRACLVSPGMGVVGYNLILSGRPTDIDDVLRLTPIPERETKPIDMLSPGLAGKHWISQISALQAFAEIEIRLYNMPEGTDERKIWEIIQQIYTTAAKNGKVVFADPNLMTIAPSQGGGDGGPIGGPLGKIGKSGTSDEFIGQWAFGPEGVRLEDPNGTRLIPDTKGKGVSVFIFDSVDERIENEILLSAEAQKRGTPLTQIEIRREYPSEPLKLTISSPAGRYHRDQAIRRPVRILSSNDGKLNVDEHGLFVAGILHRVAPESSIHLVDVLNREGRGEAYGLLKALYMLAERATTSSEERTSPPLEGVVVNLSLGTTLSESFVSQKISGHLSEMRRAAYTSPSPSHLLLSVLDDMVHHDYHIGSFRLIIKFLYELGAIMIAAAGNDSDKVVGERLKQIPAAYPEVIAVAANTIEGKKANFSNLGDIMAPGGGKPMPDVNSPSFDYETLRGEEYAQCSVISFVPKLNSDDSGYAYWRGTSFSAPFVSGLAALIVQKLTAQGGTLHPNHIRELILQYAQDEMIHVPHVLKNS